MNITINNKSVETQAANLQQLSVELDLPASGVAVAIDDQMVPRAQWAETPIAEGATLLIIRAVCGG